jgi:hypothetical protein
VRCKTSVCIDLTKSSFLTSSASDVGSLIPEAFSVFDHAITRDELIAHLKVYNLLLLELGGAAEVV